MIRISLPYLYQLGNSLDPLASLKAGPFNLIFVQQITAQTQLEQLFSNSVFSSSLRISHQLGWTLVGLLRHQTSNENFDREVGQYEIFGITNAYSQFKTAFLAEVGVFPSYFVTQKEGFDTLTLLDNGEALFPPDLPSKAPEALFDLREAGKALAFELPTACGFHVFRAIETILRRYYAKVTGGAALPKQRNLGVYLGSMREKTVGDEKILSALGQLKDLHRNPLIHPEVALTVDEAVILVGMVRSVIGAMLKVLPVIPPTTTTPLSLRRRPHLCPSRTYLALMLSPVRHSQVRSGSLISFPLSFSL